MSLSIAIVGLPNVGKSTLFNALLKRQQALAANYPFATIEPNVGIVPVPDQRLEFLAETIASTNSKSQVPNNKQVTNTNIQFLNKDNWPPIKPATVEFVDIAGLVKGASQGEGLGNQFLANIRECDLICHVVRDFSDENVLREGSVDAKTDLETIQMELLLADLSTLEKQKAPKGKISTDDSERWEVISQFKQWLEAGELINSKIQIPNDKQLQSPNLKLQKKVAQEMCLLTAKSELFVVNVSEEALSSNLDELILRYSKLLSVKPEQVIIISAQIESELSSLSDEDQVAYLHDLGLNKCGLERLIQSAYTTLGLQSFLTAGEKEVRAWTIIAGSTAVEAAGVIHTDFSKKFIKAKICSYDDFIKYNGWKGAAAAGKLRQEGRDYIMTEGDVVEFMIGS